MNELRKLTDVATLQSVTDVLAIETRRLETEISVPLKDNMLNLEPKAASAQTANTVRCYDVKLTNMASEIFENFWNTLVNLSQFYRLGSVRQVLQAVYHS